MSEQTLSVFVSAENWGNCVFCGRYDDRRFGTCFDCADFVMFNSSRGTVTDTRTGIEKMVPWVVDPMAEARQARRLIGAQQ